MDEVIDELQASMSNTHQLQGPESRRISSAWQTTGGDGLTIVDMLNIVIIVSTKLIF